MASKRIRRSQLIQPYGVGALVELEGESFIVKDISRWPRHRMKEIKLPGMKNILPGVRELKEPKDKDAVVPVGRFPRWLFCSRCRRMKFWSYQNEQEAEGKAPSCRGSKCNGNQLVPMRWVRVCDNGHLDDIDWWYMAHRHSQKTDTGQCDRSRAKMKFVTSGGRGGDFSSMQIVCECNASTSLDFIRKRLLPGKCSGKQPWQSREDAEQCTLPMFTEPRGSSALHYPRTISALAIPQETPDIDGIEILLEQVAQFMSMIKGVASKRDDIQPQLLEGLRTQVAQQAEDLDIDPDIALDIVLQKMYGEDAGAVTVEETNDEGVQRSILESEFAVLCGDTPIDEPDFCTTHNVLSKGEGLGHYFRKITRVRRVREVRIFKGFQRRDVSSNNAFIPSDLGRKCDWLNAANVIGEAIFLEFNPDALANWEANGGDQLKGWFATQVGQALSSGLDDRLMLGLTPRFVMIHTFAHVLLRQLAFDCGYSSNALRERIYCPDAQSVGGVLIYTADSDSEGSMGGLVELAEPHKLESIIRRAIEASRWCSSDPVCRESKQQGLDGLNRAACHACCLIAETSCAFMNVFLDRVLLTGGEGLVAESDEPTGYFASMIESGG